MNTELFLSFDVSANIYFLFIHLDSLLFEASASV